MNTESNHTIMGIMAKQNEQSPIKTVVMSDGSRTEVVNPTLNNPLTNVTEDIPALHKGKGLTTKGLPNLRQRENVGKFACDTANCGYRSRFKANVRVHCNTLAHTSSSAFDNKRAKPLVTTEAETQDQTSIVSTIQISDNPSEDKETEDGNVEFSQVDIEVDNQSVLTNGVEVTQNMGEIAHLDKIPERDLSTSNKDSVTLMDDTDPLIEEEETLTTRSGRRVKKRPYDDIIDEVNDGKESRGKLTMEDLEDDDVADEDFREPIQ